MTSMLDNSASDSTPRFLRRNAPPAKARQTGRAQADHKRDFDYLPKHDAELTARYADEWIAILGGKVAGHSQYREELTRKLVDAGPLTRSPVIASLSSKLDRHAFHE